MPLTPGSIGGGSGGLLRHRKSILSESPLDKYAPPPIPEKAKEDS